MHYSAWSSKINPWQQVVISAAGPLAGATFALTILITTTSFLPKEDSFGRIITGALYRYTLLHLSQITASRSKSTERRNMGDGDTMQKNLGIHKTPYNVLAFPVLCYAINKISKI